MTYELLLEGMIRSFVALGAILAATFVLGLLAIKLKARGKWYIEFADSGVLRFEMHSASSSGVIETSHGDYYLPHTPRFMSPWPPSVPAIMQEMVYHEKFVRGNPEPIEYDIEDSTNLTMFIKQTREAETRAITQIQEGLASFAGLKNPILILIGFGVLAAITVAGVAAYFGYTMSAEMDVIIQKLANI